MWHDRITVLIMINKGLARDRLMRPHSIRSRYIDCQFNFNVNKTLCTAFIHLSFDYVRFDHLNAIRS